MRNTQSTLWVLLIKRFLQWSPQTTKLGCLLEHVSIEESACVKLVPQIVFEIGEELSCSTNGTTFEWLLYEAKGAVDAILGSDSNPPLPTINFHAYYSMVPAIWFFFLLQSIMAWIQTLYILRAFMPSQKMKS